MGGDDGLPQQYNSLMAYYNRGYAFFDPESSLIVKPGVCGYIDGSGSWHTLVNAASDAATKKANLGQIDRTNYYKPGPSTRIWGAMHTETVEMATVGVEAGAPLPAGIPAVASALAEFTLNSDIGAVLLIKGDVTKRTVETPDLFRTWARDNAEKLLVMSPSIREYGFYVVTSTYTAKDVYIKAWKNKSHKLNLGFSGGVDSVAEINANTEIYGASSASGWNHPVCKDKEEKVVFFGGWKYQYHTLTNWMRQSGDKFKEIPMEKWRGDNHIFKDPESQDDAVEVNESLVEDKAKF
ncbi:hypothetical protein MAPG_10517 [Magnaporthiopsis poae ATCC 64411]|uniref:Uncharacterized protein n=1 Tax=Magnaporthiopsis poae (strain ATCC 64411 / 73-15) TaxID=644358 RepID=A0A0C4ECT2_MAGP6|nr:hypothetical protein MAPG_10517 [Magnaporthiopsis poae ATCC 64411]